MRGHIPEDVIEEIKNRVDIVNIVSEYVTLKRAGRNLVGLCPFHKEKTPSFTVSADKQIYYCFGCGQGGGAVDFIMKAAQMTFPEALRHLAKKAGVVIPETDGASGKEGTDLREKLIRANQSAAVIFAKTLFSHAGREARDYLKSRGIREECVRTFQLGFAPDRWDHLMGHLNHEGVSPGVAAEAGLLIQKESGRFYDRFRKRLMFPIVDVSGRVIAFGGRIIGDGEPKYLNSPESPVYIKGRHLYGLFYSKEAIREKGTAIMVEGYFDLIALWNAGVKNVVATLGTALTGEQVNLLKRYTGSVMAVFDPDEAGKKALVRSLPLYLAGNLEARAVILPDGLDPADFVGRDGAERFDSVLGEAPTIEDYYISHCLGGGKSLKAKQSDEMAAIDLSLQIENPAVRNLFLKKVGEFLGVDLLLLKEEFLRKGKVAPPESAPGMAKLDLPAVNKIEMALIQLMISYPDRIQSIVQSGILDCLETADLRALGLELLEINEKAGRVDHETIMGRFEPGPLKEYLARELFEESYYEEENVDKVVSEMISQIRRQWFRQRHHELKLQLIQAEEKGELELCNRLLQEKKKLLQQQKAFQ